MTFPHRAVTAIVCALGLFFPGGCSRQKTNTSAESNKTAADKKGTADGQNVSGQNANQQNSGRNKNHPSAKAGGNDSQREGDVPDGTPAELLAHIRQMAQNISQNPPRDKAEFRSKLRLILRISEKILAANPKEEVRVEAIQAKIGMLKGLQRFGDQNAAKELLAFLKTLKNDKSATIRELALREDLLARAGQIPTLNNKEQQQLFDDTVAYVRGGDLRKRFGVGLQVAQTSEQLGQKELAARLYTTLADVLKKSKDAQLAAMASTIEGMARRLTLVGQPMHLEGTTVDGKPFRLDDYKGKVVLVDFWATWCGPCRAAMPALKERYQRYHPQGFEVVGVSLDSDKNALEEYLRSNKLPWPNLFHEGPGGQHPAAEYYGITQIPTTILIDRSGKVAALDVHGAQLDRLIAGLLKAKPSSTPSPGSKKGNGTKPPVAKTPNSKSSPKTSRQPAAKGSGKLASRTKTAGAEGGNNPSAARPPVTAPQPRRK